MRAQFEYFKLGESLRLKGGQTDKTGTVITGWLLRRKFRTNIVKP